MPDTCPKCGKPIEAGDVKCPACGEPMPEPIVAAPNKALVIFAALVPIIGVIVVLALIGGIVFVLMHHQQPATTQSMVNHPPDPAPPGANQPTIPSIPPAAETVPAAPQPLPAQPPVPPPAASPPAVPPAPAFIPPPAAAPAVDYPAPSLTDFDPAIAGPGSTLKLDGDNLSIVTRVLLISTHGEGSKRAIITSKSDKQLWIAVPDVSFADYGIIIAAFSPGGVAVLADQHTLSAESYGPDSHPHNSVVSVHGGDEIFAGDHMVILTRQGADVSMGNDCIAFLSDNVRLRAVGKRCHVYFVPPAPLEVGVSREGLTEIKALSLNFDNDAFRVKPAPPGQDQ